ncbi:hypothetical protein ABBQ38_008489 [Trebouxia sp. C0009 RCD-2024]
MQVEVPWEWNDTSVSFRDNICVHELFEKQVAAAPAATCLAFEGTFMTFATVNSKANQLARHLCTLGVGRDMPVGVLMERSFDLIIAIIAVLKAGGAYLPMDPNYPEQRLVYMAKDAEATVLLTHQGLTCRLPDGNLLTEIVDIEKCQQIISEYPVTNLNFPCLSSDLMYLIYTSGSTGNPKGVMIDHVCLVNLIDWSINEWELSLHSSILLKTAISFDPSVFEIFAPLALGGRLVIAKPGGHEDYDYMRDLITREKVTWIIMVPTVLPFFLDACESDSSTCGALTHLCCSGEAYPKSLAKRACALLPHTKIFNFYGPTEATIGVSHWLANGGKYEGVSTLPIGPPMANTHLYILDADLRPVAVGETGELHISGIMLARGYKGQPGMTADRFVHNPFSRGEKQHTRMYKTGDEAFWRSDGVVVFLGRLQEDQQVKLRGVRIELTEVEHHLSSLEGVKQALAVVHMDSIQQQHLVAYLSPKNIDIDKVREHVAKFLPKQMIPECFVLLEQLPKMPNGKADRTSLPEPQYSDMAMANYTAPSNETQEVIQQIWSKALHHDRISVSADCFQVGGNSLLAVLVVSDIQRILSVELPASQLFTDKTIASLSATVSCLQSSSVSTPGSTTENTPPVLTPQEKSHGVYCTPNQEVMILLHQLSPKTIAYSMPFAIRLSGPLDADILNQSLQILVQQQEVLYCHLTGKLISQKFLGKAIRGVMKLSMGSSQSLFRNAMVTKLVWKGVNAGLGTKMILPSTAPQFNLEQAAPVEEQYLESTLKQVVSRPYNVATGLKIQATLIPIKQQAQDAAAEVNILVINLHYSVADGWSMGVLFRDLSRAYNMLKLGEEPNMPELPLGFFEHAKWQQIGPQNKRLAGLDWWCNHLKGASLKPLLATDFARSGRPNIGQNPGGIVKVNLPVKLVHQLRHLAQRSGSSLFATVLAAFKVLLRRYSNRADLVVGTPSSGRRTPALQGNLIGCFVNLTMVRTSMTGKKLCYGVMCCDVLQLFTAM